MRCESCGMRPGLITVHVPRGVLAEKWRLCRVCDRERRGEEPPPLEEELQRIDALYPTPDAQQRRLCLVCERPARSAGQICNIHKGALKETLSQRRRGGSLPQPGSIRDRVVRHVRIEELAPRLAAAVSALRAEMDGGEA